MLRAEVAPRRRAEKVMEAAVEVLCCIAGISLIAGAGDGQAVLLDPRNSPLQPSRGAQRQIQRVREWRAVDRMSTPRSMCRAMIEVAKNPAIRAPRAEIPRVPRNDEPGKTPITRTNHAKPSRN